MKFAYASFEAFKALLFKVEVLWVVTPCRVKMEVAQTSRTLVTYHSTQDLDLKFTFVYTVKSRDSSVSLVTRLRDGRSERSGFDFRWGLRIFIFTTASRPALGSTQPPILWVPDVLTLR